MHGHLNSAGYRNGTKCNGSAICQNYHYMFFSFHLFSSDLTLCLMRHVTCAGYVLHAQHLPTEYNTGKRDIHQCTELNSNPRYYCSRSAQSDHLEWHPLYLPPLSSSKSFPASVYSHSALHYCLSFQTHSFKFLPSVALQMPSKHYIFGLSFLSFPVVIFFNSFPSSYNTRFQPADHKHLLQTFFLSSKFLQQFRYSSAIQRVSYSLETGLQGAAPTMKLGRSVTHVCFKIALYREHPV